MRNSENFDSAGPLFRRSRNSKTFGLLMLRPFGPSQLAPSVLAPWCFQPVAFRDVILMNHRTFRQFHSERLYTAGSRFSRNITCPVYGFRGAIPERGVGTGEGGILPPPHLMVVELRFYEPSHSPSAPPYGDNDACPKGRQSSSTGGAQATTVHCFGLFPRFGLPNAHRNSHLRCSNSCPTGSRS